MEEYELKIRVGKDKGFLPVNEIAKCIDKIGGVHKYSALIKVEDDVSDYAITALLDDKLVGVLNALLDSNSDILQYSSRMLY